MTEKKFFFIFHIPPRALPLPVSPPLNLWRHLTAHAQPSARAPFPASIAEINGIDYPGVNGFCCRGEDDAL